MYLLGSPVIKKDGQQAIVDTRKATALLAYLLMPRETHRRDALAGLFWPETDQSRALGALRRTLSTLKKSLGNRCLEISRDSIGISQELCIWLDVDEFKSHLEQVNTHPHSGLAECRTCRENLEYAVALYRGDFMSGFSLRDSVGFDDWQFFQADTLRNALADALRNLTTCYSSPENYETAIEYGRRWLSLDPLREEAHQVLMRLYFWSGQRNAALRQYRMCVRIMEKELSVAPLEETTDLYQQILENLLPHPDPTINSFTSIRTDQTTTIHDKSIVNKHEHPLVGRTWELDKLIQAFFNNRHKGYFYAIEGEIGVGKTRLADEFLSIAKRNGARIISTQCYEGESHLAYGPFIDGLRDCLTQIDSTPDTTLLADPWLEGVRKLFPDLYPQTSQPNAQANEESRTQAHFFEGLRQTILQICVKPGNCVLFIDDLHWADDATIELLTYIARRLHSSPLFILVSWRSTDIPAGHPIRNLLSEAKNGEYGDEVVLGRLNRDDIVKLVENTFGSQFTQTQTLASQLYKESEGSPFFAVEYLGSVKENLSQISRGDWSIPGRVRDLILSRIARVEEPGRQILSTAATIGRSFDLNTLRSASGRSEIETVRGLEMLIEMGIIIEHELNAHPAEIIYDFYHDKIREVVYQDISLARRRMLHKRVAEALTKKMRTQITKGALLGKIGQQFLQAGDDEKAAQHFKMAGEHALSVYAHNEALVYFQNALALNHPKKSSLHENIGDIHTLQGEYQAAITSYETSAALTTGKDIPRLEQKLGNIFHRIGEWDLAVCHFEAALIDMGEPDNLALLYADWSRSLLKSNKMKKAEELATQSLDFARTTGDPLPLARAYNILGIIDHDKGKIDSAKVYFEKNLEASKNTTDPSTKVAALNNLALLLAEENALGDAINLIQQAIEICTMQGDRHLEAALLNNLADFLHADGKHDVAYEQLLEAVKIFSEIRIAKGDHSPDIWKLTTW